MAKKRWIVTYTKHMKQKRKVYQDGVLELCGSSGKHQVMLYDDNEKLIDRRHLKKDEIVISGGSLSFETHIVDIGDPDGNNKSLEKPNMKLVMRPESQREKLCVEWNALYTTQMTQKTKKYHDGILRVLNCSPQMNLVTLSNEDGAILSSKYVKSVASVEMGKFCEFPNFLVEICEKRVSATQHDGYCNVSSSCKDLHRNDFTNQIALSKPEKRGKRLSSSKDCKTPLHNSNRHFKKISDNFDEKIDGAMEPTTMQLRDARQILSVLKKPSPEGRSYDSGDLIAEQGFTSELSNSYPRDVQASYERTGSSSMDGYANLQISSISTAEPVVDTNCEGSFFENVHASSILSFGYKHEKGKNMPSELCWHVAAVYKCSHMLSTISFRAATLGTLNINKGKLDSNETGSLQEMDRSISSVSAFDKATGGRYEPVSAASVDTFPSFDLGL